MLAMLMDAAYMGHWYPHADEDRTMPRAAYERRCDAVFPDCDTNTRAIAWCLGRTLWEGEAPVTLIDRQGQLGVIP